MDIRDTVSGAFGAVCCISTGQPFDVVKARLQAHTQIPGTKAPGPLVCALRTVRVEGLGGLWKGFNPALCSATTENVVVWTVNSFLRDMLKKTQGKEIKDVTRKEHALLGALTGACSATMICPSEVIKVRQQTRSNSASMQQVLHEVLRAEGVRGLFLGLGPLLMRDVPFYFLFFGAMESYFDRFVRNKYLDHKSELFHSAVGGGLAGSFAWSIVFPLDVLKTRQQVYGGKVSMRETLNAVLRQDGIKGLYRGWLPAVLRGFPANGALVLGVHVARDGLDNLFPKHDVKFNL